MDLVDKVSPNSVDRKLEAFLNNKLTIMDTASFMGGFQFALAIAKYKPEFAEYWCENSENVFPSENMMDEVMKVCE